jgi:hypothetical protein
MLTNCTRTCSIDVIYRRQKTEGPDCNGGRAACIMGQWPQLVWQVATVLISPHSVSPLSSLRYPLSKLFTYPPIMPCFPSTSPSIFLFKTQNNWTFQSWNSTGFDICQFPMFVHPLSSLQTRQLFSYSLLPSASVLRHVTNIQKQQKTTFDPNNSSKTNKCNFLLLMRKIFYIASACFSAIFSPSSGSWHQNFFKA